MHYIIILFFVLKLLTYKLYKIKNNNKELNKDLLNKKLNLKKNDLFYNKMI